MPTYERYKWCGVSRCLEVAEYECTADCKHVEKVKAKELSDKKHPRFLCTPHLRVLQKKR